MRERRIIKWKYNIHMQVTLIYDIAALIKRNEVWVSLDFGYWSHNLFECAYVTTNKEYGKERRWGG